MPSDTPTPAEIAAQIMNSKSFDGAKWHDIDTPDIIHILGVLSEHYHLLPKAETVVEYTVAWTADNGAAIPYGTQTVWRPGADHELAELQANIQKGGTDDPDRFYVAQRLQSHWAATDVAEEKL